MPKEMTAMQIAIKEFDYVDPNRTYTAQQVVNFLVTLLPVEKEQIVEAHSDGQTSIESIPHRAFAELYFNQKFTQ